MKNETALGHVLTLMTIIIWGTTFVSTKVLLEAFTPIEILFFRFTLGYLSLWAIYPRKGTYGTLRQELLFAAAGLCGVTLYFLLENIALTYTFASNVGVIISIAPFFTAFLANWLLDGEPVAYTDLICAGAGRDRYEPEDWWAHLARFLEGG